LISIYNLVLGLGLDTYMALVLALVLALGALALTPSLPIWARGKQFLSPGEILMFNLVGKLDNLLKELIY